MPPTEKNKPVVVWFQSDLRVSDNPALLAAVNTGAPVIPVYILDDISPGLWRRGGASRWWLHRSLDSLDKSLRLLGMPRLFFLKGDAFIQLNKMVQDVGAEAVFWNRRYEPWAVARDTRIKEELKGNGIRTESFNSCLMFEPWQIRNKAGGDYKVFTPYSKACLENEKGIRVTAGDCPPVNNPFKGSVQSLNLQDLELMPSIAWYKTMENEWIPGEDGAKRRLDYALKSVVTHYKETRDFPAIDGVSRLSPHLHFGEISPHQVWHAVRNLAGHLKSEKEKSNANAFLRQLLWREFSYHLLYHAPHFPDQPWNPQFKKFPWKSDENMLEKWQKGQTGYPIVDAGMRQLWRTGWMHNRVRMIVGSFLVKNLLQHWRAGEDWFWDTLVDADLGNNAAGWQWIAGCGADAAPYFRIFNPVLQSKKFDPDGAYIKTYIPELKNLPADMIHAPWENTPMEMQSYGVVLGKDYPFPIVDHATARDEALEAYAQSKTA